MVESCLCILHDSPSRDRLRRRRPLFL
jgi:hypothetical protein